MIVIAVVLGEFGYFVFCIVILGGYDIISWCLL